MLTLDQISDRTHLGLDFTDASGLRVRSYQLLDDNGRAVATADFDGPDAVRLMFAECAKHVAYAWHDYVCALVRG